MSVAGSRRGAVTVLVGLMALAMLAGAQPAAAGAKERAGASGAIVKTSDGALRGFSRTRYSAWVGIPYAAAPVGGRRLKAPQPAARWSGVRDATHSAAAACRARAGTRGTSRRALNEDCLYLNVYVPHGRTPVATASGRCWPGSTAAASPAAPVRTLIRASTSGRPAPSS